MTESQGFKLAVIMVTMFFLLSVSSLVCIAYRLSSVADLGNLYIGLGQLAEMFGIPLILTAWIVTRGMTQNGTAKVKE